MSQSSDSSDQDIPLLTDVMVEGHDPHAKTKRPTRSGAHSHGHGHEASQARKHPAPHGAAHDVAADAAHDEGRQPQATPATLSAHDEDVPVLDSVYQPAHGLVGEPGTIGEPASPPAREPAQFVPGEAEFTSGSTAERYVAPPDATATPAQPERPHASVALSDYDADLLAERLRGRFATYLNGDGRNLIEARCRDAFQDHTTWLVHQITREVALALQTEMLSWVREAIREELGQAAAGKQVP
ncbi:DUF2486 family protein [Paraburkholderia sp. LEh10]|uniref:DUF2486 family protein n=1 Tax=Paraburkholderia sp. LEh10 TaxID=2821353 RepID=UPI001AE17427|nr:DUF2486 family protein [Paraburkholderia sp. LEh10]MBP0591393.1 DUF2486 family protein [Paraburkholderia sp. LEh10]